jgi:hypothetical protein
MTTVDLGATIAPKSDQLNADDLIAGPRTITVTSVIARPKGGQGDQPIAVHFVDDNGKPYLPCKSMRRVLVQCWGRDGAGYTGRSMTLFRDESVVFGGAAVGGIRISHMSHLDRDMTMSLTASKQTRKPYTVRMLAAAPKAEKRAPVPAADKAAKAQAALADIIAELKGPDIVDVDAFVASVKDRIDRIAAHVPDAAAQLETAANEAKNQ